MNSLLRIRTFNIPKSCIYYANSTENNNVLLSYIIKCQNMIKNFRIKNFLFVFVVSEKSIECIKCQKSTFGMVRRK